MRSETVLTAQMESELMDVVRVWQMGAKTYSPVVKKKTLSK